MASPKQPQPERKRDWYPYYAGFTEEFVSEVLSEHVGEVSSVLDPWNGSGTTTAICTKRGVASVGIDINPALTVIARARLTPRSVADSLAPVGSEILEAANRYGFDLQGREEEDLLGVWMRRDGVSRVRAIQGAIHSILSDLPTSSPPSEIGSLAEALPLLACFYYSALFATIRDLLVRFRATNPTWLTAPKTSRHRVAPGWKTISDQFLHRVEYFSRRLSIGEDNTHGRDCAIRTESATKLPFETGTFGSCVTSPPYATRIDYVKGVLPELAVLGLTSAGVDYLRRASTGGPVIRGVPLDTNSLRSKTARSVIDRVKVHPSKGSRFYYSPWMSNYLKSLQRGLLETARVVQTGGPICIVVQDSYYKEVNVDLQGIVIETLETVGRELKLRRDHEVRHHRARMNPRARRYLSDRQNHESLLVFE